MRIKLNMRHSPTPWSCHIGSDKQSPNACIRDAADADVASAAAGYGHDDVNPIADIAHIVKCVNMHDDLVKALEFYDPGHPLIADARS